jgi:Ternary complex associated domain 9
MNRPAIQVALCDDEIPEQTRLRGFLKDIFDRKGFDARITTYNTLADVRAALVSRPHYVIVDNVFTGEDNAGIQFIAKEKQAYPEIIFALMTGATFNVDQLGFRLPNPDLIGTKSHVVERRYQDYLGDRLIHLSRRYPIQSLQVDDPDGKYELGSKLPREELQSLIEQAVFEGGLVHEADQLNAILRPLTGGYSGAAVLELKLVGSSRSTKIPTVVKIAPLDWIEAEMGAFSTYVKWQLPHSLRVDIVGTGRTQNWGAIAYAFVLAGEMDTATATELLRKGHVRAVDRVISDVLRSQTTAWYRPTREPGEELSKRMANSREFYPEKDTHRDDRLEAALKSVAAVEGVTIVRSEIGFQFGPANFPRIRRAIFQREWGPTPECYSHGDLNSNNIIMNSKATKLALIDFADAGRTHVFRDFISFETSIRLEWPVSSDEDAAGLLQLGQIELQALKRNYDEAPAYLQQIRRVRQVANDRFPAVPASHYAICLGLNVWKVNAVKEWPLVAQKRALACYWACLSSLQR